MADGDNRGAGFKTGFMCGSLMGGALGFLAGANTDKESLPPEMRRYLRTLQRSVQAAFREGRATAQQARDDGGVSNEDLDLNNPNL